MPVSSLHYPSIGLSLLKPALEADGAETIIRYEFLRFADRLGSAVQRVLDEQALYHSLHGEWIFAADAHERPPLDLAYVSEILLQRFGDVCTLDRLHAILSARERAPAFLDDCLAAVEQDAPDIVGFTTSFQQNCASLALARRIKARRPGAHIVFGGANCRGAMGHALLRHYPFIDAVCIDEGDEAFPAYVRAWRRGGAAAASAVPGMIVRGRPDTAPEESGAMVGDMDALPYPDFAAFFEQHRASPVATELSTPTALFETSRGCWWGQKHHCTFCGINGTAMRYRSKSQDRAYAEIAHLAERFGPDLINVDAILDQRYFTGLLPRLMQDGPAITAYYELKANLTADQLVLLSGAGIKKIQPGIESLDSTILRLMRKGCTMLQNVQTLKLAAEAGVYVEWNLLHGFPGETVEQYRGMAALMPSLFHLQPPGVCGAVRADRFSPYWARPAEYGIRIRPNPAYAHIYPFAPEAVTELAYHFDMDAPEGPELARAVAGVAARAAAWRADHPARRLALHDCGGDALEIEDGRQAGPAVTQRVGGIEAAILRAAWQAVSRASLRVALDADGAVLDAAIERLRARGLMLAEGGRVLTLALRQPGYARAPLWEEIRAGAQRPFLAADQVPARACTSCGVAE